MSHRSLLPYATPAKQRQRLRWLIREHGLALVAAAIGLDPSTVAKFQVGDDLSPKSRHAISRAFAELGVSLGLDALDAPARRNTTASLHLVTDRNLSLPAAAAVIRANGGSPEAAVLAAAEDELQTPGVGGAILPEERVELGRRLPGGSSS